MVAFGGVYSKTHLLDEYFTCSGYVGSVGSFIIGGAVLDGSGDYYVAADESWWLLDIAIRVSFGLGP